MLRTVIILALSGLPFLANADDCAFRADRSVDIDAGGLTGLKLDTGAGDLTVEGMPNLNRIEVRGKACASEQAALAGLQIEQRRDGASAIVATRIPDQGSSWSLFGNHYAYIDVTVRMPAQLALTLRDSSGDLEIGGVSGTVHLTDSSGDIRLHDLGGAVEISDTSGDIRADGIGGTITILSDSSGDIDIANVKGDAMVHQDSSGDIDLAHVAGNARVDRDSSGDIGFRDIGKDASVGADGSGDIFADGVRGNFSVGAKSSHGGEIRQRNVSGKVSLPPEE
ncbi:MAG: DUF4097 family beta strand repeat-containing protein [Rhodanobacteraceae bacterium]